MTKIYVGGWRQDCVTEENNYVDSVIGLWLYAHQNSKVDYQIVVFVDEPHVYYIRGYQNQDYKHVDYSKASCFTRTFTALSEAKRTIALLVAMGVEDAMG